MPVSLPLASTFNAVAVIVVDVAFVVLEDVVDPRNISWMLYVLAVLMVTTCD
jgi:hypothetical protein